MARCRDDECSCPAKWYDASSLSLTAREAPLPILVLADACQADAAVRADSGLSPSRYCAAEMPTSVTASQMRHCTKGLELAVFCRERAAQSRHRWCSQPKSKEALSREMPH